MFITHEFPKLFLLVLLLKHRLQVISDLEGSFGLFLNLIDGDAVGNFHKGQSLGEVYIEDALKESVSERKCKGSIIPTYQLSNNARDACSASQRECALLHNLGVALLVRVLHGHDNLGSCRVAHKVHGTTEALDLAWKHPVGEVTSCADLHGAQNSKVDSAASDHAEALLAAKDGSTRVQCDSLLAGIDEVSILLALFRVRAQAKNTILGLELDLDLGTDKSRSQHGHSNTQVGIHAVLELLGGAANDAVALCSSLAASQSSLGLGVILVLGPSVLLNVLLAGALDDALDVDARKVHSFGGDLTGFHNVLSLDNGHLGIPAHGAVKVVGGQAELAVAELVCFVGLDKGVIACNAFLKKVGLAVENLDVLGV